MDRILRVLVVDDSAYVRKVIKQMLSRSFFIEVVGSARDGIEALEMVEQLAPDVVTLDLIMPGMNGVEFLREQMIRRPIPVIVVSIANESGEMALAALDAGAIDFVQKPTALATERIFDISEELIAKVKSAATASMDHLQPKCSVCHPLDRPNLEIGRRGTVDMVVIGISTGGPHALKLLIPQLPVNFPVPVALVLHMPVGYTAMYAQALDKISALDVLEAEEGMKIRPGICLVAPAGRHLIFRRSAGGSVFTHLDAQPFDVPHRPSVDVLFQSAAEIYRDRVLGIIMTGMGSDGKNGAAWIKSQGGMIFTQAEETCVVYGMPRAVVEAGLSDRSVPLDSMAEAIIDII